MGIVQENLKRKSPEVQTTDYGATFIRTGGESDAAKVEETNVTMVTEATESTESTEASKTSEPAKAQKETKSKGRPKKA